MQNLIYSDANEAANPTQILDKTMAEAIRAVQIRRERPRGKTAEWTSSPSTRNSRHASRISLLNRLRVRGLYRTCATRFNRCRVTGRRDCGAGSPRRGKWRCSPKRGPLIGRGEMSHDAAPMDNETALTERGFSVDILEQDGSESNRGHRDAPRPRRGVQHRGRDDDA